MISKLKNLYNNDPVLFWVSVLTSCLIFTCLIILFALNNELNLSFYYGKNFGSYMYSLNLIMGRDVFAAFNNTEIREMLNFPSVEVIIAYLSKFSGIDLDFAGRIVNFLLFLGIISIFFRLKEFLQSHILAFALIYFLVVNQFFFYGIYTFHPAICHYFLISLSIYLFYKERFLACYIIIFALSIFKTPFAFAVVTFLCFEYYFNNNLYKENIFKLIIKERVKIIFILFLLVPVFATDMLRNHLIGQKLFSLSIEGERNTFLTDYGVIAGLMYPFKYYGITTDNILIPGLYSYENLLFLIFLFCAIIAKDIRLLIKTCFIFLIFVINFYVFLVLYLPHGYSMLGLIFVFFITLFMSYKELFNQFLHRFILAKNRLPVLLIFFIPFFVFKLLTLYAFAITNFSENKVVSLAKNFTDKNKKMLIVDSHFHNIIVRGAGIFDRQNDLVLTYRFRWDCNKYLNSYDQIFLMIDGGCITELLLAEGHFSIDIKNGRLSVLWVKDKRLKKREVTDKIEINNLYRDDTEFDIEKAKKEFTNIVYQEENIKLYRKDDEFFYIVENCISKKLVENNIRMLVYYDFIGYLKLLLEDGYSRVHRIIPRQDINILGDSMIENDTCYGKKKLRHANNIKEIEYLPSKIYQELLW